MSSKRALEEKAKIWAILTFLNAARPGNFAYKLAGFSPSSLYFSHTQSTLHYEPYSSWTYATRQTTTRWLWWLARQTGRQDHCWWWGCNRSSCWLGKNEQPAIYSTWSNCFYLSLFYPQFVRTKDLPKLHRVLGSNSVVTMDYRPDRLNIHVDDDKKVKGVNYG